MNPEQLQKLIDSGDPKQIEQAQQFLKDAGIYQGRIDGDAGNLTRSALNAFKAAQAEDQGPSEAELEQQRLELERERLERERERDEAQEQEEAEETSTEALLRRAGATAGAAGAGYGVGRWGIGSGLNYAADEAQRARNRSLAKAAENRMTGLATREGAVAGAQRSGALPPRNALLRVGGRMLPHTLSGGAMIGKGIGALSNVDEDDPAVRQDVDLATGFGLIGAGSGILERGAGYATSPGVSPNAGDISIIESKQLRRNPGQNRLLQGGEAIDGQATQVQDTSRRVEAPTDDPDAKIKARADALYNTMTRDQLREQARKAGLSTSGSKQALAERIAGYDKPIKGRVARSARKAGDAAGRAFVPLTVGALAADAAYNAAEAGQGAVEPGTGMRAEGDGTNRLLAATGAGAAGTAGGYGVMRGLEKAGEMAARYAPTATRMVGRAAGPVGMGMMAYDAYNVAQNADIDPGPKYPTTRDIGAAYREQMGYGEQPQTQGEEDAGFERDLEDLRRMMDRLP